MCLSVFFLISSTFRFVKKKINNVEPTWEMTVDNSNNYEPYSLKNENIPLIRALITMLLSLLFFMTQITLQ